MGSRFITGIFSDERKVLDSVRALRAKGYRIHDVYTPYVIHGLDDAMGVRRSRLGIVTFVAGLFGLSLAFVFQFWTSVFDWRIDVGGKPDNSTLAFLPVAFEITVLAGGLATALAFFLRSRLFPGRRQKLFDTRTTDHLFAVVLEIKDLSTDPGKAICILKQAGALETKDVMEEE